VQRTNVTDYHMDALQPLLIALSYLWLRNRRHGLFAVAFVLLLCTKEDAGLYGLGIGLCVGCRPERRRAGLLVAALSLVVMPVIFFGVMPLFRSGGYVFAGRYAYLREGGAAVFRVLADPARLRGPAFFIACLGVLPLVEPRALLLFVPAALPLLLSGHEYSYTFNLYYGISTTALVWIAAALGAGRLVRRSRSPSRLAAGWTAYLLAAGGLASVLSGYSPLAMGTGPGALGRDPRSALLREVMGRVPGDASVCAQMRLMPVFAHRREVYLFEGLARRPFTGEDEPPAYVVLDARGVIEPLIKTPAYRADLKRLLFDGDYGAIEAVDGFLLLERGAPTQGNAAAWRSAFLDIQVERMPGACGRNVEDPAASNRVARFAPRDARGQLLAGLPAIYEPGVYEAVLHARTRSGTGEAGWFQADAAARVRVPIRATEGTGYRAIKLRFRAVGGRPVRFVIHTFGRADLWADRITIRPPDAAPGGATTSTE
jgi:hypothetical protein